MTLKGVLFATFYNVYKTGIYFVTGKHSPTKYVDAELITMQQ